MNTRPLTHRITVQLDAGIIHAGSPRERTLPACTVEIVIDGGQLRDLALQAQRNRTRRAKAGPAIAKIIRIEPQPR